MAAPHPLGSSETNVPISNGFNHVATLSTDLDRLAAFYKDAFDADVVFSMEQEGDHPRMFIIDLGGGAALNAFQVTEDALIGERRRIGGRGAIDHYAISVESLPVMEDVKERIVAAGGEVGEIQRLGGEWSLFFRDIDGMELEVCSKAAD
jgi:catechol 2,3-dioxygenase-like lactoylglutathione lyase family enzyme